MKNLLSTTAFAAAIAFSGAAFADEDDNASLLEKILGDVEALQIGLVNTSENYADINSTIDIEIDSEDMAETVLDALLPNGTEITALGETLDFDGMIETLSISTTGDTIAGELAFYDPSDVLQQLSVLTNGTDILIDQISSTAIGSLNTGNIGQMEVTADGSNFTSMAFDITSAAAETSKSVAGSAIAEAGFYPITGPILMSNVSLNMAEEITSDIKVYTSALANVQDVSGTAIGSLNTGNIAADLTASIVGNGSRLPN